MKKMLFLAAASFFLGLSRTYEKHNHLILIMILIIQNSNLGNMIIKI